jgi:hypothetical protein
LSSTSENEVYDFDQEIFSEDAAIKEEQERSSKFTPKRQSSFGEIEERRRKVFFGLMSGKKMKELAEELNVSIPTIQIDKNYIESAAYDALKTEVDKKAIWIALASMQQLDNVIVKLNKIISQNKFKKSVIWTNPETGRPEVIELEVVPTVAEIINSIKALIDASKTKADLAINNYVFITESESLKKLETDVLKIDLDREDITDYPSGFLPPKEFTEGVEKFEQETEKGKSDIPPEESINNEQKAS